MCQVSGAILFVGLVQICSEVVLCTEVIQKHSSMWIGSVSVELLNAEAS